MLLPLHGIFSFIQIKLSQKKKIKMASNNLELDKTAATYAKSRVHNTTSLGLSSLPNICKYFTHSMLTCEQSHAYQDQRIDLKDN